jgi:hypothetical protein
MTFYFKFQNFSLGQQFAKHFSFNHSAAINHDHVYMQREISLVEALRCFETFSEIITRLIC